MSRLHNLKQTAIAVDQLTNCLIGSLVSIFKREHKVWADETLSAYLWRQHKYWYIDWLRKAVDVLFFVFTRKWGHCERSYENEKTSQHLPHDER